MNSAIVKSIKKVFSVFSRQVEASKALITEPNPESKLLESLYRRTTKEGVLKEKTESNTDPTFKSTVVVTQCHWTYELALGDYILKAKEHHEVVYSFGDSFWEWGTLEILLGGSSICNASGNLREISSWNVKDGIIPRELKLS